MHVYKGKISSNETWIGHSTVYGVDGVHRTAYQTRLWIGRLRLHIFHRGDQDPDYHDHPWGFWTFPLTSYVEEVVEVIHHNLVTTVDRATRTILWDDHAGEYFQAPAVISILTKQPKRQTVRAWHWHYRPATHTHRVLGALAGGKIITLVWRERKSRAWGFLKLRDGRWCWQPWKEYVFNGGKSAPCQ